ncbi:DUF6473 family protein [Maritimibacter sp. UBA3975]|uniref:DUF6473 family protein n=1 Tax=Maritimibacter sp. UBA3975 TaxID=1946833 RepID=UPI000C0A72F2|nr:DUF6473 family protein [Maritimibacter sp. UBA3975]MAM61805.1 hypothetical protein [Maritimibacter sp.]|tara:strand:- start:7305 stop:8132 length:828 start_codon:yes stop_codon:yes gene_type:complete
MTYENLGEGALDYAPCRYGKSKLLFRGPKRKLNAPYVAMLGGTETYGKFVDLPFPVLTESALDMPVVNLGCVNAGIDVFSTDGTVVDIASRAEVTVIQITGAQNMSNRFYAVHPRRNDRFLRASNLLKTIYREVDFTEFNFTRHLLTALKTTSPEKFAMVEQELREAWVARMKTLVSRIDSRVVLLWLSGHAPEQPDRDTAEGSDPLFVDREMLDAVSPFVEEIVEVVVTPDEISEGFAGLAYTEFEAPAARGMLGISAHERAASALDAALRRLL